jgi:hypothetical protein
MAQARMTRQRRLRAIRRSIHSSWLRSSRECGIYALNEPHSAPRLGFQCLSVARSHRTAVKAADCLLAGCRCDTEKPKDCNARRIEAVARGFLARREAEARRQTDGARATTPKQLSEIQATAPRHSEPELEFPCSESTAAADTPTAAAARTEGQMHPPQRALQPSRKSARETPIPGRSREWIQTADFAPLRFDWLILQYYKAIPAAAYLLDRTN